MMLFELFTTFFKIGLFSFGGGYAMLSLISDEVIAHGWMKEELFVQIIGISQMTPGSIAVNTATYVGYEAAGIPGAIVATTGVLMPSLMLLLIIAGFFFRLMNHPKVKAVFYGIRPVVAGLILSAGITVARTGFIEMSTVEGERRTFLHWETILICALMSLLLLRYKKIHPVLLIGIGATMGLILFIIV